MRTAPRSFPMDEFSFASLRKSYNCIKQGIIVAKECAQHESKNAISHPNSLKSEPAFTSGLNCSIALNGLFILAVFYTLFFARYIFLPLILALFFSLLLSPIIRGMEKLRITKSVGAALVVMGLIVMLSSSVFLLIDPAKTWLDRAPLSLMRIEKKIRDIKEPVERFKHATREVEKITQVGAQKNSEIQNKEKSLSETLMGGIRKVIAGAVLILILLYFLLASGDIYLRKLVKVLPTLTDKKEAIRIVRHLQGDISTYLFSITVINLGLGLLVTLSMYLLDMPNPLLWGAIAAILNYIPYIGAMTGIVIIGLASALTFDIPRDILLPPLTYLFLSALEGYLITPLLIGKRLTLNPVVILMGLVFWGWLWGIIGAVLAVPLLVSLKIICDHIPPLNPVGEFLGR